MGFRVRINSFPNEPLFLRVCRISLLKTLWEKKKLLATSNFSFFHSVFYPFGELFTIFFKSESVVYKLFQFGKVHNLSFGKGLTDFGLRFALHKLSSKNPICDLNYRFKSALISSPSRKVGNISDDPLKYRQMSDINN